MNITFTAYWNIVLHSMVKLFGIPEGTARQLVRDYRRKLQMGPGGLRPDMVYHLEPFHLAQTLGGLEPLALTPTQQRKYQKIVREAVEEASVTGTDQEVRAYHASAE